MVAGARRYAMAHPTSANLVVKTPERGNVSRRKSKRNESPCVDICRFAAPHGWCEGCGRTRQEARLWRQMKPFARTALEKELKQRMSRMGET
ncbi:MAG: DUF1289 domain-containing protein [Pseudomonadota bacterium]|nr:DUF1289 domain-containing protein [Pseudomonadota bacterium]